VEFGVAVGYFAFGVDPEEGVADAFACRVEGGFVDAYGDGEGVVFCILAETE